VRTASSLSTLQEQMIIAAGGDPDQTDKRSIRHPRAKSKGKNAVYSASNLQACNASNVKGEASFYSLFAGLADLAPRLEFLVRYAIERGLVALVVGLFLRLRRLLVVPFFAALHLGSGGHSRRQDGYDAQHR